MRRGQTTLEFMMILGIALLVLLVTVTLSNEQGSALSTRKAELQASLAATDIGNAAREVYAQGIGARKTSLVTLPRSYNASLSGVYPYYIKVHAGRSDYIETFPFQVTGSLPGRPGTYEFLVENDGATVSIGRWLAYANVSAIDTTLFLSETHNEPITLSSLSSTSSNVTVQCNWTASDVTISCPSSSFALSAHSSVPFFVNFTVGDSAYGIYSGIVNVTVQGELGNQSIEIPASVYVLSSQPTASPSPSPTPNATNYPSLIQFAPPTPDSGSTVFSANAMFNATIDNTTVASQTFSNATFSWNGTNYTLYDDSLVLAYNFDDASAIGDTVGKVVDTSKYGNNGTIYGNTALLLHMDENSGNTTYDESAYRNNGTCYNMSGGSGVTNCNWVAGKSGSGISFDGVNDYVLSNTFSANITGDFSFGAWVKASAAQAYQQRIMDLAQASGAGFQICLYTNGTFITDNSGGPTGNVLGTAPQNDGQWHHLMGTREGTTYKFYVDGAYLGSSGGTAPTYVRVSLGAGWNYGAYFNGSIDEAMVVNRSLSAAEILNQFNAGKAKHANWDPNGKWNSALRLDGAYGRVLVSNASALNFAAPATVSLWVKSASETTATLFGIGNSGDVTQHQDICIGDGCTSTLSGELIMLGRQSSGPRLGYVTSSRSEVFDGNWHQIAATYNGTYTTLYLDGASKPLSVGQASNDGQWGGLSGIDKASVGAYFTGSLVLTGSIDEVRIWNRSLSADEIKQQYYSNLAKYAPGRWLFTYSPQDVDSGAYNYFLWTRDPVGNTSSSELRSVTFNAIRFLSPTPANASTVYINNITINASIQNVSQPSAIIFNWNSSNYTMYNDSLVLAYNFDDQSAIGDSASKVVDVSRYGNNGTIYGNTALLLRMDENAGNTTYDESVWRNNGTCYNMGGGSGTTNCSWVAGKTGTGISFDGNDDYVVIPNSNSLTLSTNDFTLEAWVKRNDNPAVNPGILAKKTNVAGADKASGYAFVISGSGSSHPYVPSLILGDGTNYEDYWPASTGDIIPLDQWTHVAAAYSFASHRAQLYVNGVPVGTNKSSSGNITNLSESNSMLIGKLNYAAYNLNGSLDEIGVYSKALTVSEVAAHYNAGKAKHADWGPSGKWGSALRFDGVDDYVDSGDSAGLNVTGPITVSAWVNYAGSGNADVLSKIKLSNGYGPYSLFFSNSLQGFVESADGSTWGTLIQVNNAYAPGWHHIAATGNGIIANVYVDGSLVGSDSSPAASKVLIPEHTMVGWYDGTAYNRHFNGSIDEVRVWNRSLSAAEIQQQYYSNLAKYAPDRWLFTSVRQGVDSGAYGYRLFASSLSGSNWSNVSSDSRSVTFNGILFLPQTPLNAPTVFINNITITASVQNTTVPSQVVFNWNGANYTMYNDSLVLAYNFDDMAAIGDTAAKVVDVSRYGNNGTIYGNTALLLRMEDDDSANITDESVNHNNGRFYGNTALLLHMEEADPTSIADGSTNLNNGKLYGNTALLLHMDENAGNTAYDKGVYANNATCYNMNGGSGVTNCNWTTGKAGLGVSFDGVNDYAVVAASSSINLSSKMSVSWWMNPGVQAESWGNGIISKYGIDNGQWSIATAGSGSSVILYTSYNGAYNPLFFTQSGWHHYTMTIDGLSVVGYVDGIQASNGTLPIPLPTNALNLYIGAEYSPSWGKWMYFNGSIDEVMVASRSLSASEVLAQYNAGQAKHADWVAGKSGAGILFDGVNDYVDLDLRSGAIPYGQNNVSVCAWVKWNKVPNSSQIVVAYGGDDGDKGFLLEYFSDNTMTALFYGAGSAKFSITPTENTWYHIAGTYDHSKVRIYVNGLLANETSATANIIVSTTLRVGGQYNRNTYFNGTIDEVGIYNKSLSASEVLSRYNSGRARHADSVAGKSGYGLRFDGLNDYLATGPFAISSPGNSTLTMSMWVNSSLSASYQTLLSDDAQGVGGYLFVYRNAAGDHLCFQYGNGTYYYGLYFPGYFTGLDNTLVHIVVVADYPAGTVDVYRNGVFFARQYAGYPMLFPYYNRSKYIGAYNPTGHFFNGTIDEVALYSRGLSAYEVSSLYSEGRARHADWTPDGKWGSAMRFDGAKDYLEVPDSGGLDGTPALTVQAWVKPASASGGGIIDKHIGCPDGCGNDGNSWFLYGGQSLFFAVYSGTGLSQASYHSVSANPPLPIGQWSHVIVTFNSGNASIYVNGALAATNTSSSITTIPNAAKPLHIGSSWGCCSYISAPSGLFSGSIDEVRIWNRSLSASEVQQQYYSNLAKYSSGKWLFSSVQPELNSTAYSYYLWAANATSAGVFSELRNASFNGILFAPPTPANAATVYINNITINASIQNTVQPSSVILNWNSANYTFYNDSLVLAYN
ncbi:MAG: LamG domain-containing protein, partial [Candidatus Micrarchaeia archaeon]